MSGDVFIVDGVRTPIGRYGGALAGQRPDDLAATALRALVDRSPDLDPGHIDDVLFGDANGAGEDNRDVARMAVLLAGLPTSVPGATVNRLCGSGLEAVIEASRAVAVGDASVCVAGGVESMTRAPWVLLKPDGAFPRAHETLHSTTLERLAKLKPAFRPDGTVTAGNSSPLNDGAAAVLVTDEAGARVAGREPLARVVSRAVSAVDPPLFGIGPVEAARMALKRAGIGWGDLAVVELNEAFAAQSLACLAEWGELDPAIVNPQGGAIALGHPLGCSGARLVVTLTHQLVRRGGGYGLAAICIGVGQGLAMVLQGAS